MNILNAPETATQLPWGALLAQIEAVLADPCVHVPERLVQALPGGGSLFVMPAHDNEFAITKLITFTPSNTGTTRPTIQGDVIVFSIATGECRLVMDGPTVTARRTAAVSLLAAMQFAPNKNGPLLVVGAGAQGRAHLDAFVHGLAIGEVVIASRTDSSAQALAVYARSLGLQASVTQDANAALKDCPLVVTCTPASGIVLNASPRSDAFIAAVGSFTPQMAELGPQLCRYFAEHGSIVVDTSDAVHEAGDLLQAGLDVASFPALKDLIGKDLQRKGPVLFKSCGWAGWDLAAARTAN